MVAAETTVTSSQPPDSPIPPAVDKDTVSSLDGANRVSERYSSFPVVAVGNFRA